MSAEAIDTGGVDLTETYNSYTSWAKEGLTSIFGKNSSVIIDPIIDYGVPIIGAYVVAGVLDTIATGGYATSLVDTGMMLGIASIMLDYFAPETSHQIKQALSFNPAPGK